MDKVVVYIWINFTEKWSDKVYAPLIKCIQSFIVCFDELKLFVKFGEHLCKSDVLSAVTISNEEFHSSLDLCVSKLEELNSILWTLNIFNLWPLYLELLELDDAFLDYFWLNFIVLNVVTDCKFEKIDIILSC